MSGAGLWHRVVACAVRGMAVRRRAAHVHAGVRCRHRRACEQQCRRELPEQQDGGYGSQSGTHPRHDG